MLKTEMQIERDFFTIVRESALGKAIRGSVYRSEMRPHGAASEDIIVKFLSGLDTQTQTGIIVLNVYVPAIPYGDAGRKVADKVRIGELEQLALALVDEADTAGEYLLETEATPTTYFNEDIQQHLLAIRIKFKRTTLTRSI